jgi:hypothetical protein
MELETAGIVRAIPAPKGQDRAPASAVTIGPTGLETLPNVVS